MSKNQLIKEFVPFFNDFIIEHGVKEKNYIMINIECFKKLKYNSDILSKFLESLKGYYYLNKHYYICRENITYNQFITILRQIAKRNELEFTSKVKYLKSKYSIEYYFYIFSDI